MSSGKLFICATPIGNLEDVTLRVLRVLSEVDIIAAEDTRITRKLLNKYEIKGSLVSYHEHNKEKKSKELIGRLKRGLNIALVSDAGMPGLSDPGYRLIQSCINSDIDIEVLPGPFAAVTALVASGLPTDRFVFQGFLPKKQGQRRKALEELSQVKGTLVLYESCHRIKGFLEDTLVVLGDRPIVLARELTKKFEEIIRGNVSEVLEAAQSRELKGEIVVIISGVPRQEITPTPEAILRNLKDLMASGSIKKDAIKALSTQTGIPKRTIYEIAKNISFFDAED